jgi:hypothetical protein
MRSVGEPDAMMSAQQVNVDDIIGDLIGIWKYASLDYHVEVANNPVSYETEKANQYAITLIQLWDYMDKLPLATVEDCQVELEGRTIGKNPDITEKILRTQLIDYMVVRVEQDRA